MFWSFHQKFFNLLTISAKVPHAIELAQKALKAGQCVVIGMQATGETRIQGTVDEDGGYDAGLIQI